MAAQSDQCLVLPDASAPAGRDGRRTAARWPGGDVTGSARAPDVAAVVRALSDANVQFVLVGEPSAGEPLRLVVSRHPTNLDALGRALDRLTSAVRIPSGGAHDDGPAGAEPRRVGDALGTVPLTTRAGDVDLVFGGPRRSLYADAADRAQEREVDGRRVPWVEAIPRAEPGARVTGRMLGRRLLALADGLAHLIDHQEDGDEMPATDV